MSYVARWRMHLAVDALREHISYRELVAWLREWKDSDGESRSS